MVANPSSIIIKVISNIMSSKDEFDFEFDHAKPHNMEEIMDKVDKFSIDWDNFDVPNQDPHAASMSNSDIFNKSKKSQSQKSEKMGFEDSRDLMEISVLGTQNQKGSFRFEREDFRSYPKPNERYSKLQQLLEAAKKNSLDQFYKNIQRQNKAYEEEPGKFSNHREFRDYIRELKTQKRQKEVQVAEKEAANPFDTVNSNRLYRNVGQKMEKEEPEKNQIVKEKPQYDFVKKTSNKANPFSTGNVLPQEFQKEDFFESQVDRANQPNPAQKFHNFYEGEKLPAKAEEFNKEEDAFQFFELESKKKQERQEKEDKVALEPIREEKHNSFEKTFEEEKLDNLFKNYQAMRKNFEDLMGELKSTNEGQEKLVTELRKLKDEKLENDMKEERRERREQKEREQLEKNKKLDGIKDEIAKIKTVDKDILYSQINKKIEQLEAVVRSALEEINEEKEAKIVPKVTNYFCDHGKHFLNINKEFEKGFEEFDPQAYKEKQEMAELDQSHDKSRDLFTENIQNLQIDSRKKVAPVPNQSQMPVENAKNIQQSNANLRSPNRTSKQGSVAGSRVLESQQNFYSPLDLHLQPNMSGQFEFSRAEDQFLPEQFAQEFFPREFQNASKNLRANLTQKSSVVFESFDFHVSARFSVVDDQAHPIVAAMRVGNKCSIDLYDVHSIIYGPQGPGISTDPSTIFHEQVKKNGSFSYQVSLDKSCVEDNGFSIQISYKTDSMSKKKINFKVPLPLVQLMRPEFIYEQKFVADWSALTNELFLRPRRLDSNYLRSHEDLKLILPFVEVAEQNPDCFSYGIMFRFPKCDNVFYLKVLCFVSGRAAVSLRAQKTGDRKLKEEILNVFNFILFSPC